MNLHREFHFYQRQNIYTNLASGYLNQPWLRKGDKIQDQEGKWETLSTKGVASCISYKTWKKIQRKKTSAKINTTRSLHGDKSKVNLAPKLSPFTFSTRRCAF